MSFTNLIFLFAFLPVVIVLYYISKEKHQRIILLLASLFFYACGSIDAFLLLVVSIGVNYAFAVEITRLRESNHWVKLLLALGVAYNILILGYYKYADFILSILHIEFQREEDLILPLGLSFFTFKAISLLSDCYNARIEKVSLVESALYLSFFPQITSGPLSRYGEGRIPLSVENLYQGLMRFMIGFSKKVLLANILDNIVSDAYIVGNNITPAYAWLASICYSMELFFDFSGYSDIAIGLSQIFGYKCPENFNYPYTTKTVAEFWRRWHITLGAWFRDYVYIPMGGSRVGKVRLYLNLLTVWFLTGLWHGADWSFIAWGLFYFVLIAFEKTIDIPKKLEKSKIFEGVYRILVLIFVNFQWVLFRADDMSMGKSVIKHMLGVSGDAWWNNRALFMIQDYWIVLVSAVLLCFPVVPKLRTKLKEKGLMSGEILYHLFVMLMFVVSIAFTVSGQNNPFAYGNF